MKRANPDRERKKAALRAAFWRLERPEPDMDAVRWREQRKLL